MTVYSLPAIIALVFKLVLLAYAVRSRVRNEKTQLFLFLLVALSLHNLSEILALNYVLRHGIDWILRASGYAYFATVIPFLAILLHLSLRLSVESQKAVALPSALIYLPAVALEYLLLFTDSLVAGFRPFQFSVIRVPGSLYFLFEAYFVLYLAAALVNLSYGARRGRRPIIAGTRNRLWLAGLSPMALLMIYLILSRHLNWPQLSSTFYVPITQTFFLLVATYATHQYRLFDIEFFIPWSKVRKRKTAFYQRIQAMLAEIADLRSVKEILDQLANAMRCQVALIGGPRPLVALVQGQKIDVKNDLKLSDFPRDALEKVGHIVVANEIADSMPELHGVMKHHKVGAIVPFNGHSATSGHWMLLGEYFSDQVYTPLDFKVVETLFDKIAERFLDDLLLLRSQLADAHDDLRDYQRRLAMAWDELTTLRRKLMVTEADNHRLRNHNAGLRRERLRVVKSDLPEAIASGERTLEQYLAECEAAVIAAALKQCAGNKTKAARLVGVSPRTLHYLIERHHLDPKKYRE